MRIFVFILRSGKPPSGLHLDVMKDGKMIQVINPKLVSLLVF